jgi:sarcosine oxidase, subunit alpha
VAPPVVRRFWLGRTARTAPDGSTILEALTGARLPSVVRSVRYHRPRAPFCGTGECAGCLVRVNGRPNVRACERRVADGDRIGPGNAFPSPRFDVLGAIDLLFPHGIDTLRGFRRPAFATRAYQAVVRRLAGYGRLPPPPATLPPAPAPRRLETRLAIVGAGAAGLAAAHRAIALGVRPVVVDRGSVPVDVSGAEALSGTAATVLTSPRSGRSDPFTILGFDAEGTGVCLRATAVVVTTGSYDAPLLFEGNDRPGVVTAELALRLLRRPAPTPFRRAAIVGSGPRALEVLKALGSRAAAVVTAGEVPPELVRCAAELAVPLYPRSLIVRALGRARVRGLVLTRRGGGGRLDVPCDAIVLAHRRLPHHPLLFQAGARMSWEPRARAYYPELGPGGATTVTGLYAAGSVAGFAHEAAGASGEAAAELAVGGGPGVAATWPTPPVDGAWSEEYVTELLAAPRKGKWVVCPCEDVLLEEVEATVARGYRGLDVVKRYTGLGTGLCQGRFCVPEVLQVLAVLEGRPPAEVGYLTQRPPVVPTPLGALAPLGEEFGKEVVE